MTPMFEQIEIGSSQSLKIKKYQVRNLDIPYHFHPEIEIVLILKSTGKVFIRNAVTPFVPGDLFIFGPNVPHLLINDKIYYNKTFDVEVIVIQFHHDLFNRHLLILPEFRNIQKLLDQSKAGLKFPNIIKESLHDQLIQLLNHSGISRFATVISILDELQTTLQFELVDKFNPRSIDPKVPERIQKINRFLLQNYNRNISLAEVAEIANMNKSSFCRYFKEHTRKTFSQYLNELRIDYASKLLVEDSFSISRICYEIGYNNLPYFIRQFRRIQGMSPKQYREGNQF